MFFKKQLLIHSNRIPVKIVQESFTTFPFNIPKYFKKIPKTCPFSKVVTPNNGTLKTCSGFINYFKKCIIFKAPYDIFIKIENQGGKRTIVSYFGNGSYNQYGTQNLSHMHNDQFLDYIDQSKYDLIFKLSFGIFLKSNAAILVNNPWWSFNNFEIIPGILNGKNGIELNLFMPLEKSTTEIYIKRGQDLCVLNLETSKKVKLIFKEEIFDKRNILNSSEYNFSNLKQMLLDKKFKNE
jgi:hypothetical protein